MSRWPVLAAARRPRQASQVERAFFTRQLAGLVGAGVPMMQALDVISRSTVQAHWSGVVQSLRLDVATGHGLTESMRRHPRCFPALYCNLIEAGEAAGLLDRTLARLADQEEKAAALSRQLRSALTYPLVVLAVAVLVVGIVMTQVVPTFGDVFASFGAELPALTRVVIGASEAIGRHGLWVIAVLGASAGVAWRAVQRSPSRRRWLDERLLRTPGFGPVLQRAVMARWSRTFAAVFGAGLTVVDALTHAGQSAGNAAVAHATLQAQREVTRGQPLADSLQISGLFTPLVVQMAAIGEASGSLEQMLERAADALESEVDATVKTLSSLLEPMIIVVLGTLIGTVVVAMYLPILQLGSIA